MERNIYIIGPRACGKTSVGRALARKLGVEFVDTDHAFVELSGMQIAEFVDKNGWNGFRDMESRILEDVSRQGAKVIGCGGGIVLRKENRVVLKSGFVLYLKVSPQVLVERLTRDPNEAQRPALTGRRVVDEVDQVLAEREPLYDECAHEVISGDDKFSRVLDMVYEAVVKGSGKTA